MHLTTDVSDDLYVVCCRVVNQKFEIDYAISGC